MTRAIHGARPGHRSGNGHAAKLFRMVTLILTAVVAWLALRPSTGVESGLPWDKANHAMAFLALTVVAGLGWPGLSRIQLILIMLAAGVAIELAQGLPAIGRDADVLDVVADGVGVAVGLAVLAGMRRRARREATAVKE